MSTARDIDDTATSAVPVPARLISVMYAFAIIVIVGASFAIAALPLPSTGGVMPAYGAAMFCIDFITAILLFAQSSIPHDRGRFNLGRAYLCSALFIIPHMLSFPDVFGIESVTGTATSTDLVAGADVAFYVAKRDGRSETQCLTFVGSVWNRVSAKRFNAWASVDLLGVM